MIEILKTLKYNCKQLRVGSNTICDLAAKLRKDEARLCLNISKMEERLQRLAPDPGLVEEVERLAVERTVREADVILSCLSSPLERYLHLAFFLFMNFLLQLLH